jgi:hypothetical protein
MLLEGWYPIHPLYLEERVRIVKQKERIINAHFNEVANV